MCISFERKIKGVTFHLDEQFYTPEEARAFRQTLGKLGVRARVIPNYPLYSWDVQKWAIFIHEGDFDKYCEMTELVPGTCSTRIKASYLAKVV